MDMMRNADEIQIGECATPEEARMAYRRETPEERWRREHMNQHLQLVSRKEWLAGQTHDRRVEWSLIGVGAVFDFLVICLAVNAWIL